MLKLIFMVCFLAVLFINIAFAQSLIKDINSDSKDAFTNTDNPECTVMGQVVYFVSNDGILGKELYKLDPTKGAVLVKDLNKMPNGPGTDSADIYNMVAMGTSLFFFASDGIHQNSLWKYTGTDIVLVKDFKADARAYSYIPSLKPNSNCTLSPRRNRRNRIGIDKSIVVLDGKTLFFAANDGVNGSELWKSDGTTQGTVMVKDIQSGSDSSGIYNMVVMEKVVYFFADDDGTPNNELWRSDGTEIGTFKVAEINGSGDSEPEQLTVIGKSLYFVATKNGTDYTLFKSLGTEATTSDDITPTGLSDPDWLTPVGNILYFSGKDSTHGVELWRTNGSQSTTIMLKDINPDTSDSSPNHIIAGTNNTIFFFASDGSNGSELWKSDGTAQGTLMVSNINPTTGSQPPDDYLYAFTLVGSLVYFPASDGTNGIELWVSDGTGSGTKITRDIFAGSSNSWPLFATNCAGTLYFTASDTPASRTDKKGRELWKCTGSTIATVATACVSDINKKSTHAFKTDNTNLISKLGTSLYFVADDGTSGYELWKSDGTLAGTKQVVNLTPERGDSVFYELKGTTAALFFVKDSGSPNNYHILYKSKGTSDTSDNKPVQYQETDIQAEKLTANGSYIYFTHINQSNKMWVVDGGTTTTNTWATHGAGGADNYFKNLQVARVVSNVLYFTATATRNGVDDTFTTLWKISTPASNAVEIKDNTAQSIKNVADIRAVGAVIYLINENGNLWKLDAAGKGVEVKTFGSDKAKSLLGGAGSFLFFSVEKTGPVYELWQSKGTAADTVNVKNSAIASFELSSYDSGKSAGTKFFFEINDGARTVWITDGTQANTKVLRDSKGSVFSNADFITGETGKLLFRFDDGSGYELWESDGTPAATKMVKDINPFGSIGVYGVFVSGTTVYLVIDDGISGRELWKK